METLSLCSLAEQLPPLLTWEPHLNDLTARIASRFARKEAREQARAYVCGLLSSVERKNGWQLAEQLGHANPYRVQHLLDRAVWDHAGVRDDLLTYVRQHLADPQGVLVVDETGFLKQGFHSCGVKRQYSGTAGRVENCQVGVFVAYATQHGHTLLDGALYLPQEWAEDASRRTAAKVPEEIAFATKPHLAQQMLARALDARVPAAWVTGDCVYGSDPALRGFLQQRQQGYVLAIHSDARLLCEGGQIRALTLAARVPPSAWQTLSCGAGAKGERRYAWAYVPLEAPEQAGWEQGLLVRRSLSEATELAYYRVFAPAQTSLSTLVRVAGMRWSIESCFASAKNEVGLDQYEVRSWHGWHRHITLCLLAHAVLAVVRKNSGAQPSPREPQPDLTKGGTSQPRNSLGTFKQARGLCCP